MTALLKRLVLDSVAGETREFPGDIYVTETKTEPGLVEEFLVEVGSDHAKIALEVSRSPQYHRGVWTKFLTSPVGP